MEEYTANAFANRDEPLNVLSVSYDNVDASSSDREPTRKRDRLRKSISPNRLRDKVQAAHAARNEETDSGSSGRPSIQDRLFTKLLEQVIPTEDYDGSREDKIDRRSSMYVQRPAFSLPTMTNNFRRFNARIGIVFVFQNRLIRLFSWKTTTHTLSFLAVYTFVCLDPYLLAALPLAVGLLFIMVPAFIARHPPPPPPPQASASTADHYSSYSYSGPAIAPASTIRPAAETSKDFFRNMRDLQNSMADFTSAHDAMVSLIAPATNFSDEVLSSTVFLLLFMLANCLFISAHLIPWRAVALIIGYSMTISGHPRVQEWMIKQQKKAEKRAATARTNALTNPYQLTISIPVFNLSIPLPSNVVTLKLQNTISLLSAITLSSTPPTREVEIFELQHRPISAPGSHTTSEWSPHLYTPSPYDPLSPARIAGDRPRGTPFFEDIQPPQGWEWHGKKWELDLEAGEWVGERLIVGVEYDVMQRDNDEDGNRPNINRTSTMISTDRRDSINADFGGWVWDLPPPPGTSGIREEDVWLAYGDYELPEKEKEAAVAAAKKRKGKKPSAGAKDWEETIRYGDRGRTGEWRRRRWVRVVRRTEMRGDGLS